MLTFSLAYLRKMAIDGYILTLNMPEIRELIFLMRNMSNNQNQIAKRVNMSGNLYTDDLAEIKAQQQRLWETVSTRFWDDWERRFEKI